MNQRRFSRFGIATLPVLSGTMLLATAVSVRAGEEAPTLEELQQQLADARAELGKFGDYDAIKAERDKHAGELQRIADANKTDAERQADALKTAERDRDQARETAKTTSVRLEIERAARKAGIGDEDAAYKLLDLAKVEYDADGKPKNVAELVETLAKEKPYLVAESGEQSANRGNAGNGARPRQNATGTFTHSQIADPAFYRANEAAIHKAAAEGRVVPG